MKKYDAQYAKIWLVVYIAIGIFGVVLLGVSLRTHLMLIDLQRMGESTQGVTVDIDTYTSGGRRGGSTSVKVRTVQYEVDGKRYNANMSAYGGIGQEVDVIYDPEKPWRAASAESVERAGIGTFLERNILAFVCIVGGIVGFTRQRIEMKKKA